jgi:hypothetical protein
MRGRIAPVLLDSSEERGFDGRMAGEQRPERVREEMRIDGELAHRDELPAGGATFVTSEVSPRASFSTSVFENVLPEPRVEEHGHRRLAEELESVPAAKRDDTLRGSELARDLFHALLR